MLTYTCTVYGLDVCPLNKAQNEVVELCAWKSFSKIIWH